MKCDYVPLSSGHIYSNKTNQILKPSDNGRGYQHLVLRINGKGIDTYVHRYIAEHLIPNPNGYVEVNHIDGDKANNAVENLEWCTSSQNKNHSVKIGLIKTRFVSQFDLNGVFLTRYTDAKTASYHTGIGHQCIRRVCHGVRKQAGSFLWQYS